MRFEIRAGGAFLILIGLAGLSGVVFALGLVAGYQMARQTSPDTSQVASVYPLPNPPPGSQPSEAPSPAEANAAPSPAIVPQVAAKPPAKPVAAAAPSIAAPAPAAQTAPPRSVAKATAPPASVPKPAEEGADTGTATDHGSRGERSAVASAPVRHKPYNIQIDAVMDRTNAQQMAAKLQRLGYRAYMVPTEIGDQTWYRVRVGPYDTQEEAAAAEQELRARYRMSYPRQ
jgi:septal ring-binding cell division protein DamX